LLLLVSSVLGCVGDDRNVASGDRGQPAVQAPAPSSTPAPPPISTEDVASSTPAPPPISTEDVAWGLELGGRVLVLAAHSGGETTVVHHPTHDSAMLYEMSSVVQRRGPAGEPRWLLDLPDRRVTAAVATPDGGTLVGLIELPITMENPWPAVERGELVHITAAGEIDWRLLQEGISGLRALTVDGDGNATAVWASADGTRTMLRKHAPGGAVLEEREVPADTRHAVADIRGAIYLAGLSWVEQWTPQGELAWRRDLGELRVELSGLAVLPDGTVVVGALFSRDFDWAGASVRYDPDRSFNPAPLLLALDRGGAPLWSDAAPLGGRRRGLPVVGVDGDVVWPWVSRETDGRFTGAWLRVDAGGTEPVWERDVPPDLLASQFAAGEGSIVFAGRYDSSTPVLIGDLVLWRGGGFVAAIRR
jgi:hypothetical protein